MTKKINKLKDHNINIERIEKLNIEDHELKFKILDNEKTMLFRVLYKDENGIFKSHRYSYAKSKTKEQALQDAKTKQQQLITDYLSTL